MSADLQCLKVEEVAERLCVSKVTVHGLIDEGFLKYIQVGKRRRVLRTELERFMGVSQKETQEKETREKETQEMETQERKTETSEAHALSQYADRWKLNLLRRRE